jgi:hypothetical protein
MTKFIKVTLIVSPYDEPKYITRYYNVRYVHSIDPISKPEHVIFTKIHIQDHNGVHQEFNIKETPEEILAQLK